MFESFRNLADMDVFSKSDPSKTSCRAAILITLRGIQWIYCVDHGTLLSFNSNVYFINVPICHLSALCYLSNLVVLGENVDNVILIKKKHFAETIIIDACMCLRQEREWEGGYRGVHYRNWNEKSEVLAANACSPIFIITSGIALFSCKKSCMN